MGNDWIVKGCHVFGRRSYLPNVRVSTTRRNLEEGYGKVIQHLPILID